jgi:CheY-like chemotaxis protein
MASLEVNPFRNLPRARSHTLMLTTGSKLSPEHLQGLLLQHKYLGAVRRVARGVAHGYNNIFTGLGGQVALLRQDTDLPSDFLCKRAELVGDLFQRGIEQTAILSGIARDVDNATRSHYPLALAAKTVDLLHCISPVHRFELVSAVQKEQFVCNARDIVLLLFYLGENCVEATPEGGVVVFEVCREETDTGQGPPELTFRFRDRGPGFTDRILAVLGDPFVTTRAGSPFRGLGIHAAQVLAGRNNGRIIFSGRRGDETVVSAAFPLAAEKPGVHESEIAADEPKNRIKNKLKRQCFLVVEDEAAIRAMLFHKLQHRGHMVFCVPSCAQALEEYALLHDIITTVLLDVGLPDASGYECYRKIVEINPRAQIIFMFGQEAMPPQENAGNTVFLQKPFTLEQLEKVVCDGHS